MATMRFWVIAFAMSATVTLGVRADATTPDRVAAPQPPEFSSSAWLPSWQSGAATEVAANARVFDSANLFWWDVEGCRSVHTLRDSSADRERLSQAGLRQIGTLTASGLTSSAAVACLGPARSRADHVRMLVRLAQQQHLAGLDLDYEHLALTTSRRQAVRLRAAFTAFVGELCPALRARGLTCTVTVMPRWSDEPDVWRGKSIPWIYDYAALSTHVDRLRVMAYDQHAYQFGPGPVAGYPWVRRVARWALTQVSAAQLELGIATYGRDFAGGGHRNLFGNEALALARSVGATPRFDPRQRELTFTYVRSGQRHTVWFSNPQAVAERTRLAQELGLAGVVYWAASLGQPGTWAAVRSVRGL